LALKLVINGQLEMLDNATSKSLVF